MTTDFEHFWVVDVEGNGASPPEIIELAMVEIRASRLTGKTLHWFIKPQEPITHNVTRIHGITNDDVAREPSIEDIQDDVFLWIENIPIIGHNVKIEVDALKRSIVDWSPAMAIDTLKMTKNLKPGLASYGLENLGSEFNLAKQAAQLTGRKHHSALYDATLTALLFLNLLQTVAEKDHYKVIVEADILNQPQGQLL